MEDASCPNTVEATPTDEIAQALTRQRDELRSFLTAQRERLDGAETKLTEQVRQLAQELAQAQADVRRAKEEQAARGEQLARDAENLAQLKQELETSQAQWHEAQKEAAGQQRQLADQIYKSQQALNERFDELTKRESEIAQAQARLHHGEEELSLAKTRYERQEQELAKSRQALEAEFESLKNRREEIAEQQTQTEQQRRRIAAKLEEQRLAGQRDLEQMRADIERLATDRLAELHRELSDTEQNREELESRLNQTIEHENLLESELATVRQTCSRLEAKLSEQSAGEPAGDDGFSKQLQAERDALEERLGEAQLRLAELERQLEEARDAGKTDDKQDYQHRYEEAVEDLQELKTKNEALEDQLAKMRSSATQVSLPQSEATDWESQKIRLLAALEDLDEEDEEETKQRIEIEKVLQETNATIIAKDQEIEELRRLVDQQSQQTPPADDEDRDVSEILDQDAIIQKEREKLQRLQQELDAKLRQAEIDISIERADIARQRVEIEEVMRQFAEDAPPSNASLAEDAAVDERWPKRRWLKRLGLKKPNGEGG